MLKDQIIAAVAAARSALDDLVRPAKLVVRAQPVHVPGTAPTYPETLYDVDIAIVTYSNREIFKSADRIDVSDRQGIIFRTNSQPIPQVNNLIRQGSTDYRIIKADHVSAGDAVVMTTTQLRPM